MLSQCQNFILFSLLKNILLYIHVTFSIFIRPLIDNTEYFHILVIVNNAAMRGAYIFSRYCFCFLWTNTQK